ncbi:hypothetical protein Nmel_012003 [Mimus melanotis]
MNGAFFLCFSGVWFWFVGEFCVSQCWFFSLVFLFCLVLVFLFACWCSFGFFFFVCFMELGVVVGWVWGTFIWLFLGMVVNVSIFY